MRQLPYALAQDMLVLWLAIVSQRAIDPLEQRYDPRRRDTGAGFCPFPIASVQLSKGAKT
jgi:hypothetical protein